MFLRAQTEECDYEKNEDDPESDGDTEINEQQSEYDDSIIQENQLSEDQDNKSASEVNMNGENDDELGNFITSDKDYSEVMVVVIE